MKIKFLIISFICFSSFSFSQITEIDTVEVVSADHQKNWIATDSVLTSDYKTDNAVYPKKLDPKFRAKYKSEDYNYDITKPKVSLWEKIMRKLSEIFSKIFGKTDPNKVASYTTNTLRIIGIIIVGVVLYILINFLLGKQGNLFFGKRNKKIKINAEDIQENIHEINFPERIAHFENQAEYRHAIRYHFLYLLKQLTDKKIIDWNPEKTNRDYIIEFKNQSQKKDFQKMAYIYDYVWYGEFSLDESDYNTFKNQYKAYKLWTKLSKYI